MDMWIPSQKTVIAHRGAAACAPENTLASFALASSHGADCIEFDLHATKDNVLVCIHDRALDRTTNVCDVFPERSRRLVQDFSLAELKTLDCGAWFAPEYRGETIPTFAEVLDWSRGRIAALAELKHPETYKPDGIDLLALFDAEIKRHGVLNSRFDGPPLTVQSFHEPSVVRAGRMYRGQVPVVLLCQAEDAIACLSGSRLDIIASVATGLGPEKSSLEVCPQLVARAHDAGLRVVPWTFRASSPGRFENVQAEIAHYLHALDVDGVITDNPDEAVAVVHNPSA
jgi:glycerophosphoryl diester phosphodiesterase